MLSQVRLLLASGGARLVLALAVTALGYLGLAIVGVQAALAGLNISPFWPAAGLAVAAVWRGGPWMALGVALGSFAFNARFGVELALLWALGGALACLVAGVTLRRLGVDRQLATVGDVVRLLVVIPACTLIAAAIGSSTAVFSGAHQTEWLDTALTWWIGDSVGAVVFAPVFASLALPRRGWGRPVETGLATVAVVLIPIMVMGPGILNRPGLSPLAYLALPPLLWVATRFSPPAAAAAGMLVACIAVALTVFGFGPFLAFSDLNLGMLGLQGFVVTAVVMSLVVSAVFSQRRLATAELRASEERYRLVSEHARDLICLHDLDGRYRWISPSVRRVLGYDPEALIGQDPFEYFHPDDAPMVRERSHRPLIEGAVVNAVEYRVRRADGTWIWLETVAQLVADAQGRPFAIQTVSRDITQRKFDQERVTKARESAIHAERMAALGTLAGGVAHEFNNLNAVILGGCELLVRRGQLDDVTRQRVEQIANAAERSREITAGLLDFVRDRPSAQAPPLDLREAVRATVRLCGSVLNKRGCRPQVELPEHDIAVRASTGALGQVVLNLLLNAADAVTGRSDGRVIIAVSGDERHGRIAVSDNGVGIAAELLPQIFVPFFTTKGPLAQGPGAQPELTGTGLGLSVCDTLVRQMGGHIAVDSQPGQGTTFTIVLPLATGSGALATLTIPGQPLGRRLRILVCDDEDDLRQLLIEHLSDLGHRCVPAVDGGQALEHLEAGEFDLVILDMRMPGLDGAAVLAHIATHPERTWPPILVASGWDADALSDPPPASVVGILRKPFRIDELKEAIEGAVGR